MRNRWSEREAAQFDESRAHEYCARLLTEEREFALPGGASVSVKGARRNVFGEDEAAVWIAEAGTDAARAAAVLDLAYLRRLRCLETLSDAGLVAELRSRRFDGAGSIRGPETLIHAFIWAKY